MTTTGNSFSQLGYDDEGRTASTPLLTPIHGKASARLAEGKNSILLKSAPSTVKTRKSQVSDVSQFASDKCTSQEEPSGDQFRGYQLP
ncbi:hypothetical protein K466DRAFT_668678 [Polyporus arcularius HHB13444]|uniref:Uncharacterized protein n=1 Tax=Polyporus arcularius HHB13444 TaxID=1314778 RepID=A0A5C3NKP4_9APHY|nr:hypothetical protein K466DRAFT_668678 [Polyporus arcularius HHB13444]